MSVEVLPPTVSAPPDLFTVRLLNVWLAAVPLMLCAPDPLNVMVPAPGVKVAPLLVKSPATFVFVPAVNVPEVRRISPETDSVLGPVKDPAVRVKSLDTFNVAVLPPTLSVPPDLLTTRSLKVCVPTVPLINCAPAPSKVIEPVPGLKVPPEFVQFPETSIVVEGELSVPLLRITLVTSIVPVAPVTVPPETCKPPLRVCVADEVL